METLTTKLNDLWPDKTINKELVLQVTDQLNLSAYVIENLIANWDQQELNSLSAEKLSQKIRERVIDPRHQAKAQAEIRQQKNKQIIDKVTAKAVTSQDKYWAQLMNLSESKVRISNQLINDYPELLEEGLWCEVRISYLAEQATQKCEFEIKKLIPCQETNLKIDEFKDKVGQLDTAQWKELLLRSLGFDAYRLTEREQMLILSRLIPFVEKNYNFIELGPRNTGKSYFYRQLFNKSILVSGGKTTVANLFYNLGTKEVGLVGKNDVVAFDEVAYIDFKDKTAVQILKDYMESGVFSRGQGEISAEASMVFLGNINRPLRVILNENNLFEPLPQIMKDMALIDRFHFYLPGWELNKLQEDDFTGDYGLQTSYLAMAFSSLREFDLTGVPERYFEFDSELDVRDKRAIKKTVAGYIKLLHPDSKYTKQDVKKYLDLALEGRKRVRAQLTRMGKFEYKEVNFEYRDRSTQDKYYPDLPEEEVVKQFSRKLASPGVVYVGEVVADDELALTELKVTMEAGSGNLSFVNQIDQRLKQRIRRTFLFLQRGNLASDLHYKLLENDFYVQATPILKRVTGDISNPFLIAIYSLLNNKSVTNGLLVTEESSLYRRPHSQKKLEAITVNNDGSIKTLLPAEKEGVFIEVPKQVVERAPVFIEV